VLAVILTARVLGAELGIARAVGAVVFSVVIGVTMHLIFIKEEKENEAKAAAQAEMPDEETRPLWQNALYFAAMIGVLVFANWGRPAEDAGFWSVVYQGKWLLTSVFSVALGVMLVLWFGVCWWKVVLTAIPVALLGVIAPEQPMWAFAAGVIGLSAFTSVDDGETGEWFESSWGFAKQIMPLLLIGVLIAGSLLGRVGYEGLIPSEWIADAVGGNSLASNFIASFAGAFMYFATLTEVPILQGLIGNGMGKGPALALLLAGPALSLPNMLVIRSVVGTKKTVAFVSLVIVMATISGLVFGSIF